MAWRMKRQLSNVFFLLVLTIMATTAAAALEVEITPIKDNVLPLESGTYEVIFTNDILETEVVNIRADATDWIITPQSVSVPVNGSTKTIELIITPRSGVGLSNYRIPLVFEGKRSGDVIEKSVFLSISLDLLAKGYPPNLKLNVTAMHRVDPREPYEVAVFIRNNNLREYKDLKINIMSDLFSEEVITPLQPLSTFRKKLSFSLDPEQAPGEHDLEVVITLPEEGNVIAKDVSTFEVIGYATLVYDREVRDRGLLKSAEVITLSNDGNKDLTKTITYEVTIWEDLFLKASTKGDVVRDEERKLAWGVTLAPQETQEIVLTRNYVPLAVIIIVLILAVIAYFRLRSPIIVIKEAQVSAADKQGTNEMKVRVFIKNRSRREVTKLKIIDRVPHIAEFMSHTHLGTLQPAKVTRSERKGTIVRWEIDTLEPYEERIISFKVRSKLKIIGKMSLPETKVKYEDMGSRERITMSGPMHIMRRR
ncbi:hypothetical protein GF367_01760 [Candidatus Woesearchaeota archaeon]|nr:hypothetical protein [Candidatus Woesearchaeota archaeon]